MSSSSNYGYPDRGQASPPGLEPRERGASQCGEDILVRPMRRNSLSPYLWSKASTYVFTVKVLYTFDNQNKTNCLARWPQVLDIRTARLDESTHIGIIELKTCIQAIVSASPELVAKLGQDYTVYAYDYSEYETPLVGQGMLSWVLASASSTPSAPAHQSRTMVTGRVCTSVMGLFSNGTQETLEVKLRLVPVPTSLQSEYIESMRKYRDLSRVMPEGFDAAAWTSFIEANPGILQMGDQSRSQTPGHGPGQGGQVGRMGIEQVQRLFNQGSASQGPETRHLSEQVEYQSISNLANLRTTSPAMSIQSCIPLQSGPSRNASRNSNRGSRAQHPNNQRQELAEACNFSGDDHFEDTQPRKRAKITRAEWPGNTNIGKQSESLRVAASTAASVRVFQPTAVRPSTMPAHAIEGPPRVPTPIAEPRQRIRPLLPKPRSSLHCESSNIDIETYLSPYATSEGPTKPAESAFTSPEGSRGDSISDAPPDITSSPPMFRGVSTAPSSPTLPTQPRHRQLVAAFANGSLDDAFADDAISPLSNEEPSLPIQPTKQYNLAPPACDTRDVVQNDSASTIANLSEHGGRTTTSTSRSRTRKALARTASATGLTVIAAPASDPIRPTTGGLQRSQTWSGQVPHPASDAPRVSEDLKPPKRSYTRRGSMSGSEFGDVRKSLKGGAKRKEAIQSKLATSVAAGEMPQFCENCGSIDTPTWRKAWVKVQSGNPQHIQMSDEEGGILTCQILQVDDTGIVKLFRIIKKSLLKGDHDFKQILLCNRKSMTTVQLFISLLHTACGLFLNTRKEMRPQEVWEKHQEKLAGSGIKGKSVPRGKKQKVMSALERGTAKELGESISHANGSSPPDDANADIEDPQLRVSQRPRASSLQMMNRAERLNDTAAVAALQRAIQSSPAKFLGTLHVPIDVDDVVPKPTRRVLFPSPPQKRSSNLLEGLDLNTAAKRLRENHASCGSDQESSVADQADKENCPPAVDDGLDHLFDEDHQRLASTPSRRSPSNTFKTPSRFTPSQRVPLSDDFFSSAARAMLLGPSTPVQTPSKSQSSGGMTPFSAKLAQLFSEVGNASPSTSFIGFPQLPSLGNTPKRTDTFDYSFDPHDFMSTDVPMPSSPSPDLFGVYEDPVEGDGALWGGYSFGSTPEKAKTPGLVVDENGCASVDFGQLL